MTRSRNSHKGTYHRIKGCTCGFCMKRYQRLTHRRWNWKKFYDFPFFVRIGHERSKVSRKFKTPHDAWHITYWDRYQEELTQSRKDYRESLGMWC